MIGELFNSMFDEVAGKDPATRRALALPGTLMVSFCGAGVNALGGRKSALTGPNRDDGPG
jgi:hypothetical protein